MLLAARPPIAVILFTKSSSQDVYVYDIWDFKATIGMVHCDSNSLGPVATYGTCVGMMGPGILSLAEVLDIVIHS